MLEPAESPLGSQTVALVSLAQVARVRTLNTARMIMIIIGVLSVLWNAVAILASRANYESQVDEVLQYAGLTHDDLDQERYTAAKAAALGRALAVNGGGVLVGLTFIFLGTAMYRSPVTMSIVGLVLYGTVTLALSLFDPLTLTRGVLVKIIIIAALAKAIGSAAAYDHGTRART